MVIVRRQAVGLVRRPAELPYVLVHCEGNPQSRFACQLLSKGAFQLEVRFAHGLKAKAPEAHIEMASFERGSRVSGW